MDAESSRARTALVVGIVGILALVAFELFVVLLSVQDGATAGHSASQALNQSIS